MLRINITPDSYEFHYTADEEQAGTQAVRPDTPANVIDNDHIFVEAHKPSIRLKLSWRIQSMATQVQNIFQAIRDNLSL